MSTTCMKMKKGLLFIGGKWINANSGEFLPVLNPATGEQIGSFAKGGFSETKLAITAAEKAFVEWSKFTAEQRAEYLLKWYQLLIEKLEDVAHILTLEQGKPLTEAKLEVKGAAKFIQWFAEEGKRVYGNVIPASAQDKRIITLKQPVGVVAAITPWNFPAMMVTRKIAPALAAGCTCILKPAEQTPLTAVKMFELLEETGLPAGVANLLMGEPATIGQTLLQDCRVKKVTFTGSTVVGKHLMRLAADTVKNISLELGGHAPLIIFNDANLQVAVKEAINSKFRNAGQTCVCANRIYVQEGIAKDFIEAFTNEVAKLKIGNGMNQDVSVGPLINQASYNKVAEHVEDALTKGAQLVYGGKKLKVESNEAGYFYQPTILAHVKSEMRIMQEETFGPVAAITTFNDEQDVVRDANNSPYGLAAYIFTESLSRAITISEKLEYGIVGINDGVPSTYQVPFGGMKESGIGREGGKDGIEAFVETKCISLKLK